MVLGRLPRIPWPEEVLARIVAVGFPGIDDSVSYWRVQPTTKSARFPWLTGDEFLALPLGPIEDSTKPVAWLRTNPQNREWFQDYYSIAVPLGPIEDPLQRRVLPNLQLSKQKPLFGDDVGIFPPITFTVGDDVPPYRLQLQSPRRRLYPEESPLALPLGPVSDDPFVRKIFVGRKPQVWIDDSVIFVLPAVGQILDDPALWRVRQTPLKARFPWQTGDEFLALPLGPIEDPLLWRLRPIPGKARFPWQTGDEFLALPLGPIEDPTLWRIRQTPPKARFPWVTGDEFLALPLGPIEDPLLWRLRPTIKQSRWPWQTGDEFLALPLGPIEDPLFRRVQPTPRSVHPLIWPDESLFVIFVPPPPFNLAEDAPLIKIWRPRQMQSPAQISMLAAEIGGLPVASDVAPSGTKLISISLGGNLRLTIS